MTDLSKMRQEYTSKGLEIEDLDENPFKQFEIWFNNALDAKLIEPNAFTLSTVGLNLKTKSKNCTSKNV